jgi:hypothetical protein
MAISNDHAHETSHSDELVETDADSTNLEKQQQYALAEGVDSFEPVEGVE